MGLRPATKSLLGVACFQAGPVFYTDPRSQESDRMYCTVPLGGSCRPWGVYSSERRLQQIQDPPKAFILFIIKFSSFTNLFTSLDVATFSRIANAAVTGCVVYS